MVALIPIYVVSALASEPIPRMLGNDYSVLATIPGRAVEGIWDYATFDATSGRLYLAQNGITVLDVRTGKVSPVPAQAGKLGSVAWSPLRQ